MSMSMSVERLDLLMKVSGSRTETAAREVGQRLLSLDEQRRRLEELRTYLGEYRSQPMPGTPTLIANREHFLSRLDQAQIQQLRAVVQAEESVRQSTACWVERRRDGEKMETLQAGAITRRSRIDESRVQQGIDEFALRVFALQRAAFGE